MPRAPTHSLIPLSLPLHLHSLQGSYASLGICRTAVHWRNMAIFLAVLLS